MKKNLSRLLIIWYFAVALVQAPALGQQLQKKDRQEPEAQVQANVVDPISRVKLKTDSLPDGFSITDEVRATKSQLFKTRQKIGFPLNALLNQVITYEGHRARVNYMALPNESWVDFGYTRLSLSEGQKGMIMAKDDVLIQMVSSTKELEDWLIQLLQIDRIQICKIRCHRVPRDWVFEQERFLTREELDGLEQKSGGIIRQGIEQKIIVDRIAVNIKYLDCISQESADRVGRTLSGERNVLEERLVKGYGSIVVVVDSAKDALNRELLTHMNW